MLYPRVAPQREEEIDMKHKRIISIGLSALMLVSLCALCASTGVTAAPPSGGTQAAQAKITDVIGAPPGGILAHTGPAVSSWAQYRLDVFVIGANDHNLWHKWWDGSKWNGWENLGGYLTSSPAAVSWSFSRIDIFARGGEGHCWQLWFENDWKGWSDQGGELL